MKFILELINGAINPESATLVVIAGFSPKQLESISNSSSYINGNRILFNNSDTLSHDSLEKIRNTDINKLFLIESSHVLLITHEIYVRYHAFFDFNYDIKLLLANPLVSLYRSYLTFNDGDVEEILNKYYSHTEKIGNDLYYSIDNLRYSGFKDLFTEYYNACEEPINNAKTSKITKEIYINRDDIDYILFCNNLILQGDREPYTLLYHKNTSKEDVILVRKFIDSFDLNDAVKSEEPSVKINSSEFKLREELTSLLKSYWGYESFKELEFYANPDKSNEKIKISQLDIITDMVINCDNASEGRQYRDLIVTAPTGAGKSLMFSIPAIHLMQKDRVTLVISPLKSLMQDQVEGLQDIGLFFEAAKIDSEISKQEKEEIIQNVQNGTTSILYLSPEQLLSYDIRHFIGERKLGLVVVDESHLVTTWGMSFRADYWFLGTKLRSIRNNEANPQDFPIASFTATANYGGRMDIVFATAESLFMKNPIKYLGNVRRENIGFDIKERVTGKKTRHDEELINVTMTKVEELIYQGKKSLIYFPFTAQLKKVYGRLSPDLQQKVGRYYGEGDAIEKRKTLTAFKSGDLKIVLATKAFGMGVDISDVVVVHHHAPSGNLSDYVQEIGRAARKPELIGTASLDFSPKDLIFTKQLFGLSAIRQYHISAVIDKLVQIYDIENQYVDRPTKRNLVISVDGFYHIFGEGKSADRDIVQKVKSALLLLENDLRKNFNYRFPPIVVRPKALFTKAFIAFKENEFQKMKGKISNYIEDKETINESLVAVNIDLKQFWNEKHNTFSFAHFKYLFFSGKILEGDTKLTPCSKVEIELHNHITNLNEKLNTTMEALSTIFSSFNKRFSVDDFVRNFKNETGTSISFTHAELLLNFFSTGKRVTENQTNGTERFDVLRNKRDFESGGYSYEVHKHYLLSSLFGKLKKRSERITFSDYKYSEYILDTENDILILLAYLIDIMRFGTYRIRGGSAPELALRVNSVDVLRKLQNSGYENKIVKDIAYKHKYSVNVFEYFCTKKMTDDERWDFIENYFMDRLPSTQFES